MTNHLSQLALERLSVDDLPAAERQEAVAHLAACQVCQQVLDALRDLDAERRSAVPPSQFMWRLAGRRRQRRRRLVWQTGLGLLAVATAASLWVVIPRSVLAPAGELHVKGAGVAVHRKRGVATRILASGDTVRAGDALRVVVTLPRAQAVSVWFVDAAGRVDRLHQEESFLLEAGEHELPGSAIVESPCRDLWLVLGTAGSAGSRTEQTLRQAVPHGVPSGTDWIPRGVTILPLRCE